MSLINDYTNTVECLKTTGAKSVRAGVLTIGIGLLMLPVETIPVAAASFDGSWGVTRTGRGCTPKRYISIKIKGRKVSGGYRGGTGYHRISGSISGSGTFRFVARSSSDRVSFSGKIRGKSGSGSWKVSGKSCGGSLRISK